MAEFKVGGIEYRSTKMAVMDQFHVARKMGQLFPAVMAAGRLKDEGKILHAAQVVISALGTMQDKDCQFVIDACLRTVTTIRGGIAAKLCAPDGSMMFDDVTLQDMLEIVWSVIDDNLGPFIAALLRSASEAERVQDQT